MTKDELSEIFVSLVDFPKCQYCGTVIKSVDIEWPINQVYYDANCPNCNKSTKLKMNLFCWFEVEGG